MTIWVNSGASEERDYYLTQFNLGHTPFNKVLTQVYKKRQFSNIMYRRKKRLRKDAAYFL